MTEKGIILTRQTAKEAKIYSKAVDFVKITVGMTGLVFEDTPEIRQALEGVKLDSRYDILDANIDNYEKA